MTLSKMAGELEGKNFKLFPTLFEREGKIRRSGEKPAPALNVASKKWG